ncbi:hypothetical protein H0H81_009932 [Sphagnurus paluster]|uniref:Uncharacterized protein n=1 Tax=Sphagnurus paluster TaxID=117069 RepID=A0A9P7GSR5_9AGAR|nr:hypothetical protein H0H81_009932 [Sphagnurus paluster]
MRKGNLGFPGKKMEDTRFKYLGDLYEVLIEQHYENVSETLFLHDLDATFGPLIEGLKEEFLKIRVALAPPTMVNNAVVRSDSASKKAGLLIPEATPISVTPVSPFIGVLGAPTSMPIPKAIMNTPVLSSAPTPTSIPTDSAALITLKKRETEELVCARNPKRLRIDTGPYVHQLNGSEIPRPQVQAYPAISVYASSLWRPPLPFTQDSLGDFLLGDGLKYI